MPQQKKLAPKLRFPEFSEDWEEKKIGDLCSTFKSGVGITSEHIKENGEYPVYGGNGLRGFATTYTHNGFFLLIGRQGALCGNINRSFGKSYISEHAIAVQANDESDTEWLAQRLHFYNLNRLSESSAQPGLAVNKVVKFKLFAPIKDEQEKIAEFLTSLDRRTQKLQETKSLLEEYKKGVMQQIFSQKVRFTDDNGKLYPVWEEKSFGETYSFHSTNSLSRAELSYESGSVKNIHYGDIHTKFRSNFVIAKETVPFIREEALSSKITKDSYCQVGDIIIADASEDYKDIGKAIEITNIGKVKLVAGLHTYIARPINDMGIGFSGYMMQTNAVRLQIMKIATGISVLGISKGNLSKIQLLIPSKPEQQKIADFLTAIDAKIEAVSSQITQAQTFKKGLLQQMFV